MKRLKKKHIVFLSFLLIGTIFFLNIKIFLISLADYLIVNDKNLPYSDAIVVTSGEKMRVRYGLELFHKKSAEYLILNFNTVDKVDMFWCGEIIDSHKEIDRIKDFLEEKGWLNNRVIFLDRITSTFEDATHSLTKLKELGADDAIIVSSPMHMRRVSMIFNHVFKKSGINLHYSTYSPEAEGITVKQWWKEEYSLLWIQNEYIKIIYYYFKYIFNKP